MKKALVSTSLGNTFTRPNHIAFVRTENGLEEKFVYELKPGQRGFFRTEYAPHTLEDVVGVLYDVIPNYKEDRNFLFITNKKEDKEYEIPRLRYDIINSVLELNPQLFSEQEKAQFNDSLFHVNGAEFDEATISAIANYLGEICKQENLKYSYSSRLGWITKTYHIDPVNLESGQIIAMVLGNQTFFERARKIAELPREKNPYFELTDAHRRYTRMLREVVSTEGEPKKLEKELLPKARVHECYLEWDKKVLQQFLSRKLEKIVEAVIYDVKLVDTEKNVEETPEVFFSKGLLSVKDEDKREQVYNKLKLTKAIKSRTSKLMEDIKEGYKILFELYQTAFEPLINLDGNLKALFGENRDYKHLDLKTLDFANPLYNYDSDWYLNCYIYSFQKAKELINPLDKTPSLFNFIKPLKQKERIGYRDKIKHSLTEDHPLYRLLSRIYPKSMLLETCISRPLYIDSMSTRVRALEMYLTDYYHAMNEFSKLFLTKKRDLHNKWVDESPMIYKSFYSSLKGEKQFNRLLEKMRQVDRDVPIELTVFRSYGRYRDMMKDKKVKLDQSDQLMDSLFGRYNIGTYDYTIGQFSDIREKYRDWAMAQRKDKYRLY